MRDWVVGFGIHILTASGAVWALLAAVAAVRSDWTEMFFWLGIALIVDAVDGPLARRFAIAEKLPRWDGAVLDLVIDYTTYVFIPALVFTALELLPPGQALFAAGVMALTGAIYFGDRNMKAKDNCFYGFPGVWNLVVFHLAVFQPAPILTLAVVLVFAVVTFLPVKFVHPIRVARWRKVTLAVTLAWAAATIMTLIYRLQPPTWLSVLLGLTIAYLALVGVVMQLLGPESRNEDNS